MDKTGKNRSITDQFYTNRNISLKCIKLFLETIKIKKEDIIIEPSAGNGSFSDYFKENKYNIEAYDIDPKKEYIIKKDFLDFDYSSYINNKDIHFIGNPPFGKQS